MQVASGTGRHPDPVQPTNIPAPATPADGVPVDRLRVLVAEDEGIIALLLSEVLTGMGFEVCAVEATEAAAVAAAARCRPDLMIVDARLARGSGVAAVEEILRSCGPVPHVFVSGDIIAVQARRPGSVVIAKPFREADLVSAIDRALRPAA
jgi:CheY-like chemotaxis protein